MHRDVIGSSGVITSPEISKLFGDVSFFVLTDFTHLALN